MPRAAHQSSGWEDALAAIMGGLGGGIEWWQTGKRMKREDADRQAQADRQVRADAREDAEHELRMEEQQERRRQRGERDALTMLTDLGRGAVVTPAQTAQLRDVGLEYRVEDSVDFAEGAPVAGGPAPFFLPSAVSRIAPTAAERQSDAETRSTEGRLARTRAALEAAGDTYELQAFDANPGGYKPTRDSFMPFPVKTREAQDTLRAKTDAEVERKKALQPIELEEHEGKAKIDAKYRPPPAARDRGPTDYQTFGMIDKLNARFGSNTKATREVARQYDTMITSWRALESGTGKGTAEQAIVSTFNKILDPDSVVREGEYDRTAQGQALLQRMQTVKDNLQSGGKISREVLKDMVTLAGTYATRAEAFTQAEQTRVGKIADHGQRQVDAAKADGRWDAAYAPMRSATQETAPDDLRAAIDANPRARKIFATLGRQNLFALAFRTNKMKTAAGRAKKIAELVDMLARGETIFPERPRPAAKLAAVKSPVAKRAAIKGSTVKRAAVKRPAAKRR